MHGPENSYIRNIDAENKRVPEYTTGLGFEAEMAVVDFFEHNFQGLKVRLSTASEDSGMRQIESGLQIDAVAYMTGRAVMCMQITTSTDPKFIRPKLQQLSEHPFVRLAEMNLKEASIPKVLIGLDPKEVQAYLADHDISKHPEIGRKIVKDTIISLKFDLAKTANLKEQERINTLLSLFSSMPGMVH